MFRVSKRMEIAGSHRLSLPYESKCSNLHGHNWIITVYCQSDTLTDYGMVVDFNTIKNLVHDKYDHKNINEVEPFVNQFNPTAENMAAVICNDINNYLHKINSYAYCCKVEVQESEGNIAIYVPEEV